MKFKNLPRDEHFTAHPDSSNGGKLFQKENGSEARRICFEDSKVVRTREVITFQPDAEVHAITMASPDRPLGMQVTAAGKEEQISAPM